MNWNTVVYCICFLAIGVVVCATVINNKSDQPTGSIPTEIEEIKSLQESQQ